MSPSFSLIFPWGKFYLWPCRRWINSGTFGDRKLVYNPSTGPPTATGRLVVPPWRYYYLVIHPRQYIFWEIIDFVWTVWLQVLALGRSPSLVDNFRGCAVAQKHSFSVRYNIPPLSLAWGVHFFLIICLVPQTPHLHWSVALTLIYVYLVVSLAILWSNSDVSLRVFLWCCLMSPPFVSHYLWAQWRICPVGQLV